MVPPLVRDETGAETLEFALVLPVFLLVVFVSLQFVIMGMLRYEVKYVTRETARWLAVNPDTTDAALLGTVQSNLMPLMTSSGIVSVSASPGCLSLSGGYCTSRPAGTTVTVAFSYDPSALNFIGSSFFGFSFSPSRLNSQVSVLVE